MSDIAEILRGYTRAYPVDIFPPLVYRDKSESPTIIARAAAEMMRHISKDLLRAAEEIDNLRAENQRLMEGYK